jgi:metal-responsive CopG/Arc/MetJ family transcriptional regulator
MVTTKTTSQLERGDRVQLPGGLVRTVDRIVPSGYVNYRNEVISSVMYAEGRTDEWSGGNSGVSGTTWTVEHSARVEMHHPSYGGVRLS